MLPYKAHYKMLHCFQNSLLKMISLNLELSNIIKKQKESNHKQSYSNISYNVTTYVVKQ